MIYRIIIQPTALKLLKEIGDRRIRQRISDRIDKLTESPEMQGKPLLGELDGYYSIRAVGQRYGILYTIQQTEVTVIVVALGIRKDGSKQDAYVLAKKLLRLGLLDEPEEEQDGIRPGIIALAERAIAVVFIKEKLKPQTITKIRTFRAKKSLSHYEDYDRRTSIT